MEYKLGSFVKYDSAEYGSGNGQIIDVIQKEGRAIAIVEPEYNAKERKGEVESALIAINVKDIECIIAVDVCKRMIVR